MTSSAQFRVLGGDIKPRRVVRHDDIVANLAKARGHPGVVCQIAEFNSQGAAAVRASRLRGSGDWPRFEFTTRGPVLCARYNPPN